MLRRRAFVSGLGGAGMAAAAILVVSSARAQRPAFQPIAAATGPAAGRARSQAVSTREVGVASGALPGVYVVMSVDAAADSRLQLRDDQWPHLASCTSTTACSTCNR